MSRSYRDLLGDSWNDLAPGVRLGLAPPLHAEGRLNVFRATRGLVGLMARLVEVPTAGADVSCSLDLIETENGFEWRRKFGLIDATSLQVFRGERLFERAKPLEFELQMRVCDGLVEISQIGQRLFGIPVPRFMCSVVEGRMAAGPDDTSWQVSVTITHVWFGTISNYQGVMWAR